MYAYTQNNPVMYSDISGMSPESINTAKFIGTGLIAIGAIVVGILAITTSVVTLPLLAATLLICGGVSVMLDMAAIGKQQYNYSVSNGSKSGQIFDDVINSTGSLAFDRVAYHTGIKLAIQIALGGATGLINIYTLSNSIEVTKTISRNSNIVPYIAVGFTLLRAGFTTYAMINDDYAYDYATEMGWTPWGE